jgi:hypothetical protein
MSDVGRAYLAIALSYGQGELSTEEMAYGLRHIFYGQHLDSEPKSFSTEMADVSSCAMAMFLHDDLDVAPYAKLVAYSALQAASQKSKSQLLSLDQSLCELLVEAEKAMEVN